MDLIDIGVALFFGLPAVVIWFYEPWLSIALIISGIIVALFIRDLLLAQEMSR